MKKNIKILLFSVLMIALAGIAVAYYMFNMKHADMAAAKPDFVLTAAELGKAFEDNEAEATGKFNGKILEITGIVSSVSQGKDNTISISLKTGNEMSSVICTFTTAFDSPEIKPDMEMTARGECSGFLMDVLLNNCTIIAK